MAMHTLEKILLTGTALATLAGSLIACNKKDYPVTPIEPTPIVTPAPTQEPTPTLKPYTPAPEPSPTPKPSPTPEPTPTTLGNDYLERLVQAGYSNEIGQRISYLPANETNIRFVNELLLIGNKAGYAKDKIATLALSILGDNAVNSSELAVVRNIDDDLFDNGTEIANGTNVLDKFNRLPANLESLAVLNDELYAVVAGNDSLVYAFDLQNFSSFFKELREAPYKDELMKRINAADPNENVSQAWNYKVRREDGVLFSIIGLSPSDAEGWQFRWDNGKYELDSWLAYKKTGDVNSIHILPLDNVGISELFEKKEDAEYAMMQLWVPDGMVIYDVTKWRQIAFLRDDGTPVNYTDGKPSEEAKKLAWQAMRDNISVILGKEKINGLHFKDLRDRIVGVSRDKSINSYGHPGTDFEYAMGNWERQDKTKHGGFDLVPESYGAMVVPVLEQNMNGFKLIELAYGLGVLDMTGPESWDVLVNQVYQKALGYVSLEQFGRNPLDSGDHQYAAFVTPKRVLQQLPSGILVYRGQSISPYSMEDALIADGVGYVREPNGTRIVWRLPAK